MTDTEREALCARIDELCAENEKLRGQGERLFDKTLELGTENAKLREFLQDLADHIKSDDGFGLDRGWLLDRLRGLGVIE